MADNELYRRSDHSQLFKRVDYSQYYPPAGRPPAFKELYGRPAEESISRTTKVAIGLIVAGEGIQIAGEVANVPKLSDAGFGVTVLGAYGLLHRASRKITNTIRDAIESKSAATSQE